MGGAGVTIAKLVKILCPYAPSNRVFSTPSPRERKSWKIMDASPQSVWMHPQIQSNCLYIFMLVGTSPLS